MPPLSPTNFRSTVHRHNYSTLSGGIGPPTGIGGFDLQYTPTTNELLITIKMYMTYQPAPGVGGVVWTGANKTSFEKAFKKTAADFWSRKRGFRCTLPTYTANLAIPKINIEFVTSAAAAHFSVLVYPGAGQSHLEQNGSLVLYSLDVHSNYERKKKEASTNSTCKWYQRTYKWARGQIALSGSVIAVLMAEADKFTASIAAHHKIDFAGNSSVLAGPSSAKLQSIAQIISRVHPDDPKFPLIITGFHDSVTEAATLATARAKACIASLEGFGVRREMEAAIQGTTDIANKNCAKVKIDDSPASMPNLVLKGQYKYNYSIAIHEFGHVLGLPDEYMLYNSPGYSPAIQNAHASWVQLCNGAGVPNNPYGNGPQFMTNSIMSHGTVISDCHYVTIWDALCKATAHTVPIANWQIYTP